MENEFKQFANNIRLTASQEDDARVKYNSVCEKLHASYYKSNYDGKTKFLFGSYATKTNVRPITENQDVDVLFKIPQEVYKKYEGYESNGPSALLQEIRGYLKEKYTTTDEIKAWGKIVLVKFADNTHNVELLPAFEKDDGTYIIPNSQNGGSWDKFDPREQILIFQESNNKTKGLTAEIARMVKTWVDNTTTCNYKSYNLLNDVIAFLNEKFTSGANYSEYSIVMKDFFEYLKGICDENIKSHVQTAFDRVKKANDFFDEGKPKEASEEWIKIFGKLFPSVKENPNKETTVREIKNPTSPYGEYKDSFIARY